MPRVALAGNNLAAAKALDLMLELFAPADILVLAPPEPGPSWHVSLQAHAEKRGVVCLTPSDVNDPAIAADVAAHDPDLFLSIYYTQVFRGALMDVITGRAVNFHPSLLPRHRGNAPLIWAIVEGDRATGLTVHHIDEGIDTGPIIRQHPIPIHRQDTGYSLHQKLACLVRATVADLLRDLLAGRPLPPGLDQKGQATVHSTRDARLNRIAWSDPRERIRNIVRALAPPLPGAYAMLDGNSFVVARVDPVEPRAGESRRPFGMVETRRQRIPAVWAADGPLLLSRVVFEGEETSGASLVESNVLQEGTVLS